MLTFLLSPLGKIAGVGAILVAAFLGFRLWLHNHDKAVLNGYVTIQEKVAAEAERDELKRQLDAGKIVIASYTEIANNARKKEARTSEFAEARIKEYEAKLIETGRSCGLSSDDIGELLNNGNTPQ
jgi:hypothetical protein